MPAPRRTPAARQDAVFEAAMRVFARQGFHRTTVAEVAREAGVAAGTIYLYVARKEELLVRLFQQHLGRYLTESREALFSAPVGPRRLGKLIELHLGFFEADPDRARVFQIHLREIDPVIREGIRPTMRRYLELIERVLGEGQQTGHFDPGLDLVLARKLIFGGLDSVVTSWVLSPAPRPLAASAGPICEMMLRALAPPGRMEGAR